MVLSHPAISLESKKDRQRKNCGGNDNKSFLFSRIIQRWGFYRRSKVDMVAMFYSEVWVGGSRATALLHNLQLTQTRWSQCTVCTRHGNTVA